MQLNKNNTNKTHIKSILLTMMGTAITGFSISTLLTPNKIVGGGVSGISTILYHVFSVPPGISFALINIILLLVGIKVLGKNFIFKTIVGAGLTSLFVQIFLYLPPLTENDLLASVFGGFLYGFGIGITFVAGASTGGTDILGRIMQYKFPYFKIGKLLLIIDGIVIATSLVVFKNMELTMLGIISLFLSTYSIDWLIKKLNVSKIAFVISDKGNELSKLLISTSPRGVTLINAVGAYSDANKKMLFCALKENEVPEFQKKILLCDEKAFIVYAESQQIKGNGFFVYR